jgi:tripartite-type tricarboxylate transporter receptor subunit TctC
LQRQLIRAMMRAKQHPGDLFMTLPLRRSSHSPSSVRCQMLASVIALASGVAALPAFAADNYPSKPITLIVPYVPGGMGDVFARLVGERLSVVLKQTVLVDNRPGATGAVGARLVARAAPDGYTLLLGQTGEMAINHSAMKQPGYDVLKDFKPVLLIGDAPLVLVTSQNAPYSSLKDMVAAMRAKPGSFSYASSGTGTPGHLAAAALDIGMKTQAVHVPYKGGGAAMTDVLGGQVNYFFASIATALPQIKGGKAKALALSGTEHVASLPGVPTVADSGVPGFSFSIWGGVFAPAKTPDDIVMLLNREINKIIAEPAMKAKLEEQGALVRPNTPAEFAQFVTRETTKYEEIVKRVGVTTE